MQLGSAIPIISKLLPTVFDKVRRVRAGIVEECCINSCTLSTLQSYCEN